MLYLLLLIFKNDVFSFMAVNEYIQIINTYFSFFFVFCFGLFSGSYIFLKVEDESRSIHKDKEL